MPDASYAGFCRILLDRLDCHMREPPTLTYAWDVSYTRLVTVNLQEVPRLNVAIGPEHSGYLI
jgi:hypothetical protein